MNQFDFGLKGYRPRWLTDVPAITAAHGERLASLAGRTLTNSWLVWETLADQWLSGCPVVLDFEGEQVEINHWKADELSITWNTIDTTQPVMWCLDKERPNSWRDDVSEGLAALRGQTVRTVMVLERNESEVAIGLVFTDGQLTIRNAGDENGLDFGVLDSHYRRHRLA
ncbi:hypothetical protein SAMN05421504_1021053 [Amycolatopsis xylanica]|uniref:Uncharacterized protein n=1 Tax=Amycolatopsis xylanica TaxID=589385 RepID=A0A1H3AVP4_9PSEU|nr:hypothetical protein [Amycolatopsis xylanica]SDX32909.1 hypothetical protein SAMN05421504_1021053 [Amycolatopsis xylanica]